MNRFKKGATLLIITIALSVVTITSAAFSSIYFRYGKMNESFYKTDVEKRTLRTQINVAYEHFLKDTEVTAYNETKPLRTGWLLAEPGLEYQATLSVTLSNFIANFRLEKVDKTLFGLYISGETYVIQSKIEKKTEGYTLTYVNYDRVGK